MKKKLFYLILFVSSFVIHISQAQTFILYGDKTFGGDYQDLYVNILNLGNNQFILAGSSVTNINGDKTEALCDSANHLADEWILKIDTAYNIIWDKSMGGEREERGSRIIKAGNSKFIFSCYSASDSACEKSEHNRNPSLSSDYWICMMDSGGNKIWDKTIGGSNTEQFPQIIQLNSGDFILAGTSNSPISGDKTVANYGGYDYWVVKLDSMGNKIWDKVYGGTLDETGNLNGYKFSIFKDTNNDFILAGSTLSPLSGDISDTSRGFSDIWLIKLDSAGNKLWDKRFGGSGNDYCGHIIHTNDKGYIICGSTYSPQGFDVSDSSRGGLDFWIIKTDSLGNKQWDKRYGGNNDDIANWIEQAPEGGYWVCGYTFSDSSGEVSEPNYSISSTYSDYWILKIDSLGNKLWDKRFGSQNDDVSTNFIILADSSILLCGYADEGTSVVKTDYGKGLFDYWLVHFKYSDNTTSINENSNANNFFSISPNPSSGIIKLKCNISGEATIIVSNLLGEKVFQNKIRLQQQNQFNFSDLKTGMYFLKIQNEKISSTVKFIKD